MLAAYSMYVIGLFVAIGDCCDPSPDRPKVKIQTCLLIELPEYKAPSARTVEIYVWEKVKDFVTKAGTTIFVASVIMWFILNFGPGGYTTDMENSFGAVLGKFIVPFFIPLGLGYWQIAMALIAGISAKEVVVTSCAVLFGISNVNSQAGMDSLHKMRCRYGFWRSECLLSDDLLPAVYSLCSHPRYDQKGDGRLEMGSEGSSVSAWNRLGSDTSGISDRKTVHRLTGNEKSVFGGKDG